MREQRRALSPQDGAHKGAKIEELQARHLDLEIQIAGFDLNGLFQLVSETESLVQSGPLERGGIGDEIRDA